MPVNLIDPQIMIPVRLFRSSRTHEIAMCSRTPQQRIHHELTPVMNPARNNLLLHWSREALCIARCTPTRASIARSIFRGASPHERLLCSGLRHYLGFLVRHFWLLSESVDSLFVTSSASGTRQAELVNCTHSFLNLRLPVTRMGNLCP